MPNLRNRLAVLILLLMAPAAALPASAAPAKPASPVLVVATPQGSHVLGRPDAPLKIVEYVSYTCPHCAAFEKEGTDTIALTVVRSGKGTIEYRPFLRNVIDVAATLLVGCGPPSRFFGNQSAVLRGQDKWLTVPSEAQQARWRIGDFATRMRAVAQDMKLYALFEQRGYGRADLNRCLANEKLADALAQENRKAIDELKLEGTPSFIVNGELQPAHDWATLRPVLAAATR